MSSGRVESSAEEESTGKEVQRLFFALWPDEAVREQIGSYSKSLLLNGGGRLVFPGNFHITLAFLGNVNAGQRACVEEVARGIQCPSFKLSIDNGDYWPKPRILWIGPDKMPEALITLATELRDGALECGIQMDIRPYRAHVTLMRKVARAPARMTIHPFDWIAKRFVLVKSTTLSSGVKYDVIKEWPLSEPG